MSVNFPLEIIPFTEEENETLRKVFTTTPFDYLYIGPSRYVLPTTYAQHAANIYNMPLRSDDTVVSSFPRSGCDEMMEKLSIPGYEVLANTTFPRFIKTHLAISLLPPTLLDTCKTVYVARDPRDVAVSNYHLNKDHLLLGMSAPFKDFFEFFKKDLNIWSPYFEHVKEAWSQRHHPNMLFIFYEDMSKDLKGTARRVANFLGKSYSEDSLDQLCNHLRFDNFKNNASVDVVDYRKAGVYDMEKKTFNRKGKVGGWREYFDEELAAQAQRWMNEHLRDTDLCYPSLGNINLST